MTSREKRHLASQGIDWREVEAAKRKPVEAADPVPFVETCNRVSRALPVAFAMAALALSAGVPDVPRESPKPWRGK